MIMAGTEKSKKIIFTLFILCFFHINLSAQGRTLSLDETLRNLESSVYGAVELYWDPFFSSGYFLSRDHRASFYTGRAGESGPVVFDSRETLNLPLPYTEHGTLRFPETFVQGIKNSFVSYEQYDQERYRVAGIIIDPGHGGRDPGAVYSHVMNGRTVTLQEKDINLKVSRQLYNRLTAAYPGKLIQMTREGDTFPSLEARAEMANSIPMEDNEVIIFVSVHTNSSLARSANGYEIFYLYPEFRRNLIDSSRYADAQELIPIFNDMMEEEITTQSIRLANSIMASFDKSFGSVLTSRGVKEKDYFVVRNTRMPAVLVELAFLTNENDARLLADDTYLNNFSEALYKGISDFIALFEQ